MKEIKISIIEKKGNLLLLDLGIAINNDTIHMLEKEKYLKIFNGQIELETKNLLHSFILLEIKEESIQLLEKRINEYNKNAR